jgi:tryptophan synthase alpha chain
MTRLDGTFTHLRGAGSTGLIAYVTAGDPDLPRSADVLLALDRAGADVIEVGVPFSDPVADGPVIERSAGRARAAGATLKTTLEVIGNVRRAVRAPIVLFTYGNPVFRMGEAAFAERAARSGVDGVLVLDLPVEEAGEFRTLLASWGLAMICMISPTTAETRLAQAVSLGRGFLYAISRLGVTGMREALPDSARGLVERIRARTATPVALGFGISRPEHVREVGRWADAAVVGSALVEIVGQAGRSPDLCARVEKFVRWLKGAGRGSVASADSPSSDQG